MLKEKYIVNRKMINTVCRILFLVVALVIILVPAAWYYDINIEAKTFLMDAKNIQLSMRLLNIQCYGNDRNIYQAGTESGMAEDTLEEIKHLSDTEGEIILVYWDYENNVPGKFYYRTDDFLAIYEFDTIRKEPAWEVYQLRKIIQFRRD